MKKLLEEYLVVFTKILRKLKSKKLIDSYGLIGGVAVSAIGIPRATKNIDFLIAANNPVKFYKYFKSLLGKKKYWIEFKKPEGNVFPYYSIICYSQEKKEKSRILDILISTMKWQDEISEFTINLNFAGCLIPVVNTEGLIVLKLKGGSPMDIIDVENLLKVVNINKLNRQRLENWAKRAGINKLLNKILIKSQ